MAPEGKGYFIWKIKDCEGGDVQAIANLAEQAGFTFVAIKIADGAFAYNIDWATNTDLVPPLANALRARGVEVWGWHYVYGDGPREEAARAIERVRSLALDGYIIDAEAQYKEPGKKDAAKLFMRDLRNGLGSLPIALSSYRFPSFHPQLPWREFLSRCDFNMPQVYWEFAHNPGPQLSRCLQEFQNMTPFRPILPVGSAYARGSWEPTPADVLEFMQSARALNLSALSYWEWSKTRTAALMPVWDMIRDFPWDGSAIPGDIVERYFAALNSREIQTVVDLYSPVAAHVTSSHTIKGHTAIRSWYQSLLGMILPEAEFQLTGYSGVGSSRHFTWTANSPQGRVQDGNDVFGLLNGQIVYHYTFFTVAH